MFGVKLNQLCLAPSMKMTNFIVLHGQVVAQEFLVELSHEVFVVFELVKTILQCFG